MSDPFAGYTSGLESPLSNGFDVTPNDTTDLLTSTRAIMVTASGDVAIQFVDGGELVLPNLQAGQVYPMRARKIKIAGTTATGIKGFY